MPSPPRLNDQVFKGTGLDELLQLVGTHEATLKDSYFATNDLIFIPSHRISI